MRQLWKEASVRTKDLSPALIGKRIYVQGDGLDVIGVLRDLGVTVEAVSTFDGFPSGSVQVVDVRATIGQHELHLTGDETCSVVGESVARKTPGPIRVTGWLPATNPGEDPEALIR